MISDKEYFNEVKKLEREFGKLKLDDLDFRYPKRTNSRSERKKFLKAYENGEKYNPQLKFKRYLNYDEQVVQAIKSLKIDLKNDKYGIKKLYTLKQQEMVHMYKCYSTWGELESSEHCVKFRGQPSDALLKRAVSYCKKFKRETVKFKVVDVYEVARAMQEEVTRLTYGKETLKVIIAELANKAVINAKRNQMKLNPHERFTTLDIERFKVHEIGVHYMRAVNAKMTGVKLLAKGTAQYIETEEGLAVYMEDVKGVLSKAQMYIYAGRVIATYYATRKDFYGVFKELKKYGFKDSDAYTITLRAKRNLSDTSQKGGFTKDYVYFKGYHKVKAFAKKHDIKDLFIGKIRIEDLKILEKFVKLHRKNIRTILDSE